MSSRVSFARRAVGALTVLAALQSWGAEPLTLAEAQRLALGRSQQLAANDASASAARRMAQAAAQLPDPVLKFGVDNLPLSGTDRFSLTRDFMTMRRIGVMQELPGADKRRLRGQRGAQEALKVQAEREMVRVGLLRGTAQAWADRYYALASRELVLRQLEETRLQVQAAEAAYRGAKGSQADVFMARGAVGMLEDKLAQVDRQADNAVAMLARWVGDDAQRLPVGAPPWQSTEMERGVTTEHLETHPEVAVAAAVVRAAQVDVFLAEANKRPDWTVEANFQQRGPGYPNMLSIGLSVPLQLDRANRQDQEVAAKGAQLDEALARYEDALRSQEAEVRVMLNDWRSGKQRVARYADSLVPLAQQRTEAALSAYRGGKGDLASVLAARRDELELRIQALAAELETARAWASLNFITADHDMPASQGSQP
jgi:outer membrane protein TolC